MFELVAEPLPGLRLIAPPVFQDVRGEFVKTWHPELASMLGVEMSMAEEFFSTSRRGVIRGMHFQRPPHDQHKLVMCLVGEVLDVVVDLRRDSSTYGLHAAVTLSATNRHLLFVPAGFAHGFLGVADLSLMVYKASAPYHPKSDTGIRWNSFGFTWPQADPVLSERDQRHPPLDGFTSPF